MAQHAARSLGGGSASRRHHHLRIDAPGQPLCAGEAGDPARPAQRFLPLISLPASKPGGSIDGPLFLRSSHFGCPRCRRSGWPRARPVPGTPYKAHDGCCSNVPSQLHKPEIVVHRAARRKVLRDVPPLAAGAQHIHHAVDHLAHLRCACRHLAWPVEWLDMRPFRAGQVARITQLVAVIAMAVLGRPHRAPREQVPDRITPDRAGSSSPCSWRVTNSINSECPRTDTLSSVACLSPPFVAKCDELWGQDTQGVREWVDERGRSKGGVFANPKAPEVAGCIARSRTPNGTGGARGRSLRT